MTAGEFRDWAGQRVARMDSASRGDKKPDGGRSGEPNGPSSDFGIALKMQARSFDLSEGAYRKVRRR